jgi:hypothetical protein
MDAIKAASAKLSLLPAKRYTLGKTSMRKRQILPTLSLAVVAAFTTAPAFAQPPQAKPAAKAPASQGLLPPAFSGWEAATPAQNLTDPAQADPANAAALKEYGFTDGQSNTYRRNGETLTLKALRFEDASGSYGAYTFYRHDNWPKEDVGTGATSDNSRVLFWLGNVVVDANFSKISTMSGAALRDLASQIPLPGGNKAIAPPILGNLPQKNIDGQTTHYALGPAGYAGAGGVLPPNLVAFDHGAETATASYKLSSGKATLTIINYPTPQMAAAQAKAIQDYLKAGDGPQHPFTQPLKDSNPTVLEVRRSGPLVAVVSGDPIQDEARKLISAVHFDADTSPIPGGGDSDVQKTAKLLIGIITLVAVMFAAAVLLAVFLGGGRAAYRRMRGKPMSSVYDAEFTSLALGDQDLRDGSKK